ncbi:UNVERIFIED_CONTAM: hypothetical protein FKN15_031985 [Acipenser sinensis]
MVVNAWFAVRNEKDVILRYLGGAGLAALDLAGLAALGVADTSALGGAGQAAPGGAGQAAPGGAGQRDKQTQAVRDRQPQAVRDRQTQAVQDRQPQAVQDRQPQAVRDRQPQAGSAYFASLAHQHTQRLRCWLRGSTIVRPPQRISMTTVWIELSKEESVRSREENYCTKPFHSKTVLVKALPRRGCRKRLVSPGGRWDLVRSGPGRRQSGLRKGSQDSGMGNGRISWKATPLEEGCYDQGQAEDHEKA